MVKWLPVDPALETEEQTHFTWRLPNWTELEKTELSPKFECGGSKWRILLYPHGNSHNQHLSVYLKHGYDEGEMPGHWSACVQFTLVLWNTESPSSYISKNAKFRFSTDGPDWGFTKFCELRKLLGYLGDKPSLLGNEEANITAYVRTIRDHTGVLWHTFLDYDSKKATGLIGLKNLGSTGYLNVILQIFYFTNLFRKVTKIKKTVYQLPLDNDSSKNTFLWALQRLFYSLQTDDSPVSALELTRGLGWGPQHLFMQQDVQEMARVFMERFTVESKLSDIFLGRVKSYVSVDGVQKLRIEEFLDISLNVQNIPSLAESFQDYTRENTDEERTEHGIRKTTTGVIFGSFPTVLHLHLKRYAYDMTQRQLLKVNDTFSYPEEFDASPYLSVDSDKSEPWIYRLTGVVVHSGGVHGGRYWVYLRPSPNGSFYKFDDDRVTRAMLRNVIEENYGAEGKATNAYMLLYVRKSRIDDILVDVKEADIPTYIKTGLAQDRETAERQKKEREEDPLYMGISLITASSFRHHDGFDLANNDLDQDDKAASTFIRVLKETTVGDFTQQVAQKLSLDHCHIALWVCINRQNGTRRPHVPLLQPEVTIEKAFLNVAARGKIHQLWVEVGPTVAGVRVPPPKVTTEGTTIMIFLKYFDVVNQTLRGVNTLYVQRGSAVGPAVLTAMGWPSDVKFSVREEVKPSMILSVDVNTTFERAELGNGDILCVQRRVKRNELPPNLRARDVTQYFDNLRNSDATTGLRHLRLYHNGSSIENPSDIDCSSETVHKPVNDSDHFICCSNFDVDTVGDHDNEDQGAAWDWCGSNQGGSRSQEDHLYCPAPNGLGLRRGNDVTVTER
ncbi:uncharacterized protein PADG_00107 [Paracoccidioides brasiliensis Pb18]|uniref:Ubiquitinyl hydrolase 1 n=1 Tax=Paracoccidioides brasiliensis (strain Pb18) TaxID=502780 RepID=C1FZR7_PARBD|nr:uncharacterized protein PADG_00107 [Paracoccidioides brasiliensis Pb18]EEH43818.2 hypothetical protein PADG_00107 [Paracoccidioides brasiliensis Pb18]